MQQRCIKRWRIASYTFLFKSLTFGNRRSSCHVWNDSACLCVWLCAYMHRRCWHLTKIKPGKNECGETSINYKNLAIYILLMASKLKKNVCHLRPNKGVENHTKSLSFTPKKRRWKLKKCTKNACHLYINNGVDTC